MKDYSVFKRLPLLFIPLFTAYIASADSLTASNLSVIAYGGGQRTAFVLWGLILAFYIPYFMQYLFRLANYENKVSTLLLFGVSGLSIVAVTTPYAPQYFPFRSWLHIVFSFAFPLLFLGLFTSFLLFLSKENESHFRVLWYIISATAVISIVLLASLRVVTSLLELVITSATFLLIFLLERKLLQLPQN